MSGRAARRRTLRRVSALALGGALAALVLGGAWSLLAPVGPGPAQLVTVSPGESVSDVAMGLWERGLIRNGRTLTTAAYVTGKWRRVQAGRHEVDPGMSALEVLDALARGSRRTWHWVTIPEGFSARQIAERIEAEQLGRASEFMKAASDPSRFDVGFPLPSAGAEGYLFPDTYRVDSGSTERDMVAQMLRRFEEVVWEGLFEGAAEYKGRSLSEIVTLASLVEWEARVTEERPVIAGVLMNRLKLGRRLECDATVQYALGEGRKSRLMYEDLRIESEYNTYRNTGLPPGPICSPGEASIRAAMEPAETPYLYYVAREDGSHIFSRTYAEHLQAIARVRGRR